MAFLVFLLLLVVFLLLSLISSATSSSILRIDEIARSISHSASAIISDTAEHTLDSNQESIIFSDNSNLGASTMIGIGCVSRIKRMIAMLLLTSDEIHTIIKQYSMDKRKFRASFMDIA